ncbi:MAG: transcriptional repressor [Candidatus Moranbacteria bacterium]|nr:transcriptional repressor [Candidatus Moranbacteria bacterium]
METAELEKKIRERNGRMTRVRKAMLDFFGKAETPLTPSMLMELLARRRITVNRTTIYRELRFLEETGVIREVRLVGKKRMFELAGGHRHHLVCLGCHNVKAVAFKNHLDSEERRLLRDERFQVADHSLEYYGYCERCQGVLV